MKVRKDPKGTLIVGLERGDDVRASVEALAQKEGIACARVSAIGAVEGAELGYYDLQRKEYLRKTFAGIWELVTLEGNITLKDSRPFLHAHVSIAGADYELRGGHLFDARVAVVVEMFIDIFSEPLPRRYQEDVGLPCWHLESAAE